MHKIYNLNAKNRQTSAARLFAGWQETLIWSCLQGVMGCVYADHPDEPETAAAVLGDFCFLAGKPSSAFLTALSKEVCQDFLIMVPADGVWDGTIEAVMGERAKRITRYATKKDTRFDIEKLKNMAAAVPEGLELKKLDGALFHLAKETPWCRDWVSQYDTYEDYGESGMGVVLMEGGAPVSGASSYSSYNGGIEIEIDTREDCRRKGFARICGAALILRCLEKGWYPSWDAHNQASLALARQLGYEPDHPYTAYEIKERKAGGFMNVSKEITVRRAEAGDLKAIMALQIATFNGEQAIPEGVIRLRDGQQPQWWAAFCGGRLMGAVASWKEEGVQHAGRFAVTPESRGLGIGKLLARKAFDDLFAQGIEEIYMEARDVSVHIVEAMGGEVTGEPFDFYVGTVTPMKIRRESYVRK